MTIALASTIAYAAPAAADIPLPITTIQSFKIYDWRVTCTGVDSLDTRCDAERRIAKGCLSLHFDSKQAFAEIRRTCSEEHGVRKAIKLSRDAPTDAKYAMEDLASTNGVDYRFISRERFGDQLSNVASFMFKLTNG